MLKKLIKWLNPLDVLIEKLSEAYIKKTSAKTEEQRIKAEVLIKTLELKKEILLQELKFSSTRWIRPALVIPFLIYDFKVLVIDYALGLGTTPMLPDPWWTLHWIVYGFYFLGRPFEKVFRK